MNPDLAAGTAVLRSSGHGVSVPAPPRPLDVLSSAVGLLAPAATLLAACVVEAREDVFLGGSAALTLAAIWTLWRRPRSEWLGRMARGMLWGWAALVGGFLLCLAVLMVLIDTGLDAGSFLGFQSERRVTQRAE